MGVINSQSLSDNFRIGASAASWASSISMGVYSAVSGLATAVMGLDMLTGGTADPKLVLGGAALTGVGALTAQKLSQVSKWLADPVFPNPLPQGTARSIMISSAVAGGLTGAVVTTGTAVGVSMAAMDAYTHYTDDDGFGYDVNDAVVPYVID